jgi:hypothetical protein
MTLMGLSLAQQGDRAIKRPLIQLSARLNARARARTPLLPELQVSHENSDRP